MPLPVTTLSDGATIPQLGFGVWQMSDNEAHAAVAAALEAGYRHIDTAAAYQNEQGVGNGIAAAGLPREEVFVTTKLWNTDHARPDVRRALETSLSKLGLDQVDLYLIHWPAVKRYGDLYIEAWDAMQQAKADGLVRSIGVSNFQPHHLDALRGEVPVVDQIEMHPTFNQAALRAELARRGIAPEAWSPLGQSRDLGNAQIGSIAASLDVTPAQVIVRWHLQIGNIVIPKSVHPDRIKANIDVDGFELSDEQVAAINALDSGNRIGAHPDSADF